MNRHVVAGMIGLALAGCSLERSGAKRPNPNMPAVEMTPPLPSIHAAINQENPEVDPASLPAVVSRPDAAEPAAAPAPRQMAGAPVGDEAPAEAGTTVAEAGTVAEGQGRPSPFADRRPTGPRPRAGEAVAAAEPVEPAPPEAVAETGEANPLPPAAEAPAPAAAATVAAAPAAAEGTEEAVPIRRPVPVAGGVAANEGPAARAAAGEGPVIDAVPPMDDRPAPAPEGTPTTAQAAATPEPATPPETGPAAPPVAAEPTPTGPTAPAGRVAPDPLLGPNPALMPSMTPPGLAARPRNARPEAAPTGPAEGPVVDAVPAAEPAPAPAPATGTEPSAAPEAIPGPPAEAAPAPAPVPAPAAGEPASPAIPSTLPAAPAELPGPGQAGETPPAEAAPATAVPEAAPAAEAAPAGTLPEPAEAEPTVPVAEGNGGRPVMGRPPHLLPGTPPAQVEPAAEAVPTAEAPAEPTPDPVAMPEAAAPPASPAPVAGRPSVAPAPPAEPPPAYRFNFDVNRPSTARGPDQDAIFGAPPSGVPAAPAAVAGPAPAQAPVEAAAPAIAGSAPNRAPNQAQAPAPMSRPVVPLAQRPGRATAADSFLGPNGEMLPSATPPVPQPPRMAAAPAATAPPAGSTPPARVAGTPKTDEKTRAAGARPASGPEAAEAPVELPPLSGPEASHRRPPKRADGVAARGARPRIIRVSYQPPAREGRPPAPVQVDVPRGRPAAPAAVAAATPEVAPPGPLALPDTLMPAASAPLAAASRPRPVTLRDPAVQTASATLAMPGPATAPPDPMAVRQPSERSVFEEGAAAAHVGNEVITLLELKKAIRLRRRGMPAGPLSREDNYTLAKVVLNELVDRTIVMQEARRLLKDPKQLQNFTKQADALWIEEELPPLLRQTASANIYELKQKLAERDESLDEIRDAFRQEFLFRGFLEFKIGPKLRVDLPEMMEYYRQHVREFNRPALLTWREVVVEVARQPDRAAARRKAEVLLQRLARGEDFAALARAESDGPNKGDGGLWRTSPGSYAVAEVNAALDRLSPGQVSPLVEGPSSFHILRVEARRPAGPATFSEVQDQVRKSIRSEKVARESNDYLGRLRRATVVRTVFDDPSVRRASATPAETAGQAGWDTAPARR